MAKHRTITEVPDPDQTFVSDIGHLHLVYTVFQDTLERGGMFTVPPELIEAIQKVIAFKPAIARANPRLPFHWLHEVVLDSELYIFILDLANDHNWLKVRFASSGRPYPHVTWTGPLKNLPGLLKDLNNKGYFKEKLSLQEMIYIARNTFNVKISTPAMKKGKAWRAAQIPDLNKGTE